MARLTRLAALALSPALLLAACGGSDEGTQASADSDAALAAALGDQIMVDPDLAGQNRANSAVSANIGNGELPPEMRSPEAIARARAEALKLVGGPGGMKKAPAAIESSGKLPADAAYSIAARAAANPGNEDCTKAIDYANPADYTTLWAAKLPATFPVYPQGSVQEAAGTDTGACALRVVSFITPVPLGEVIDFYYTRAAAGGFKTQHLQDGDDDVLGGVKGKQSFTVYARKLPTGLTEVDLVTSGG